jgi:hypothetical protein
MKRYVLPLFVLLPICLVAGVWLEFAFGETGMNRGLMFQRSGALVVLLGTAYGFVDAARYAKIGTSYTPDEIEKINAAMRQGNLVMMVNYKLDLLKHAQDVRGDLLKYEAYVLMLGTFIWGFGDLAYRLF